MPFAHRAKSRAFVGVLLVLSLAAGCGRIGVEILPAEAGALEEGDPSDAGSRDFDSGDGDDEGGFGELDAGRDDFDTSVQDLDGSDSNANDGQLIADALLDTEVVPCLDGSCASCSGTLYTPNASCGIGYCRTTNVPSRCVGGVEVACVPGSPRASSDATCDGVDDDCSGAADEDYASPMLQCGTGYCRTNSVAASCVGGVARACQPGSPRASDDTTIDGVDDDCDGQTDEDACVARTDTYRAGSFSFMPPAGCTTMTVRLWGGGGASGNAQAGFWLNVTGGQGGAGGYAEQTFAASASSMVQLNVGSGGQSCPGPGVGGIAAHNGGAGGTAIGQAGNNGADGSRAGGGGGNPSSGGNGGNGSFGGGGGGAGSEPGFARHGSGGGGGAGTVFVFNGVSVIAGGGGGGGGAGANITTAGFSGGNGGTGCNGMGAAPTNEGGGGGGGGICQGATRTQPGNGRIPYDPNGALPTGYATGGNSSSDCQAGGDGYATVTYGP